MKTIFLDRDGVINEDIGYIGHWRDFKFINGSVKALQKLTKNHFRIIIVTNQSGIARGYFTKDNFETLTKKFVEFCNQNQIEILNTFFCPHHIEGIVDHYSKHCNDRKPNPGMFLRAAKIYNINLKKAIMVGDKLTDIIASSNAGIKKNFLVNTDKINAINKNINFEIKANLLEVTNEILK